MIWKVKLRQLSPVLQKVVAGDGYLCQETMERTVHLTAGPCATTHRDWVALLGAVLLAGFAWRKARRH